MTGAGRQPAEAGVDWLGSRSTGERGQDPSGEAPAPLSPLEQKVGVRGVTLAGFLVGAVGISVVGPVA